MISGCPTAAAYDILGFSLGASTHNAGVQRIFDLGTAIHQMLQEQYSKASLLKVDKKGNPMVEVAVAIPEWDLVGHADGIVGKHVYGKYAVLEVKSINSNAFTSLKAPKEEHKMQSAAYVIALAKELEGSRLAIVVYYSKNDSKIKEFKYVVTDTDIQRVEDRVKLIKDLIRKFVEEGIVPEPYFDNANKIPCCYCRWQSACHDSLHRHSWVVQVKEAYYATPKKAKTKKPETKKAGIRKPPKRRS
jgi:predicted RecB family nuclease